MTMSSIFHWLIVGGIVLFIWSLFRATKSRSKITGPRLRTTGDYFREIVGESNYQPAIRAAAGGQPTGDEGVKCIAALVPEDDNRHDKNAVVVKINGNIVGYLPREQARLYRGRLKRAGLPLGTYSCPAKIFGGGGKQYGIWLDLPDRLSDS